MSTNLYSSLADVYEAMYDTFIDYQEEYHFYDEILAKYNTTSLLEIGSGTGKLAAYFEQNGYAYIGLDLSPEMIEIAQKRLPDSQFIEGDMRAFTLAKAVDSIIITGRTISYLLENKDVLSTFKSISNNLKIGGILSFDFIDANRFVPSIHPEKAITHEATSKGVSYVRKSRWSPKLATGMDVVWAAKYFKKEATELVKIADDHSVVRTFTKDEIELFLLLNGFEIKEVIDRATYAFPTYVIVAEKL